MKKLILFAFIFLASSMLNVAMADKKKKKKGAEPEKPALQLLTSSDSLSYAAGLSATQGLLNFLHTQMHVDSAHMADFERGFVDAQTKMKDPTFMAYMAGINIAQQAENQILPGMGRALQGTPDSLEARMFNEGFLAGVREDTTFFTTEKAGEFYRKRNTALREKAEAAYKAENEKWLKINATKEGVTVLPSGLQYKVLRAGNGAVPKKEDMVHVAYEGKTIDGNVFDATSKHGDKKFDAFRCDQVIKGWTEALTMMPVGSKWEVYIPQQLAYGGRAAGNIKPYSTLIFTIDLQDIEAPKAPADAKADKTADSTKKATASKSASKKRKK